MATFTTNQNKSINNANSMKHLKLISVVLTMFIFATHLKSQDLEKNRVQNTDSIEIVVKKIWNESSFKEAISFDIFLKAMKGYYEYKSFKPGLISIIDYSKPSTEKRLYVIDLENKCLIFNTLIAHGKNSGNNVALKFSNTPKSLQSSLGFYKTAKTYSGKHGYSLKLDGLEKGINNNARIRSIVIHGADYVNAGFIKKHGRLGRSWGCPAIPESKTNEIINTIANGSCLFIFAKNDEYFKSSEFFN